VVELLSVHQPVVQQLVYIPKQFYHWPRSHAQSVFEYRYVCFGDDLQDVLQIVWLLYCPYIIPLDYVYEDLGVEVDGLAIELLMLLH
jgi:hypothetical protein